MNRLWHKFVRALALLQPRSAGPSGALEEPRFICRCPVTWESAGQRGRAELRQMTAEEMRLLTDRPLLAGCPIRVRPVLVESAPSLLLDEVQGTVLSSRRVSRGVSVVLRLQLPKQVSRFAWFRQLRRPRGGVRPSRSPRQVGLRLVEPG